MIEETGTIVYLENLNRQQSPAIRYIRQRLARRFGVLGEEFLVEVNSEALEVEERNIKQRCEFTWEVDEELDCKNNPTIRGWIGTTSSPVKDEIGNGVVVMARGKLCQDQDAFGVAGTGVTGQAALAYLVGEIHADFLDQEEDLISTSRTSVFWDREPAKTLYDFINQKIKKICREWVEKRKDKKLEKIRETPMYKERIADLPSRQKDLIDDFLSELAGKDEVNEESILETADFLASGVEYQSFMDLVYDIDQADIREPQKLFELFKEWEVIDALELLRVAQGRYQTLKKFGELIDKNAKEIPDIHDFIVDNPWLLDPKWDYVDEEVHYRDLLKEEHPKEELEEGNRRIDFICLGSGESLRVIELKRPDVTIGKTQMRQLEDYVDFVRDKLGTGPGNYQSVKGFIIGDKISQREEAKRQAERLESDMMYVRTYRNLRSTAEKTHEHIVDVFKRKAERTGDQRLLSRVEQMEEGSD